MDRSKNTALIPPGFGTPTSYLPNSGEYLTPNLVPGALDGGLVNQMGSVGNPNDGTSTDAAGSYPAPSTSLDSAGFPTVDTGVSGTGSQRVHHRRWRLYPEGGPGLCQAPHRELLIRNYAPC